ncbi:MAG: Fur family transcriptional regulator [Pseudomonadota bacterium]
MADTRVKRPLRPLTDKERRVADALATFDGPASAYDIIGRLNDVQLKAPPTIYRALNRLIERGLAHKLESVNAYVACSHEHGDGHCATPDHGMNSVFALCADCKSVTEFGQPEVVQALRAWADGNGFELSSMTLELQGRCADCRDR